uniref:Uncharacterized protein n=1 Tax=viral metagenome TaxID=1070528 RepID=A0A6C0J5P6_9ZZZZ
MSSNNIEIQNSSQVSKPTFQKMLFIINALEQGWAVRKNNDTYIFTKKHENRQEIFQENYLETFVASNLATNVI